MRLLLGALEADRLESGRPLPTVALLRNPRRETASRGDTDHARRARWPQFRRNQGRERRRPGDRLAPTAGAWARYQSAVGPSAAPRGSATCLGHINPGVSVRALSEPGEGYACFSSGQMLPIAGL